MLNTLSYGLSKVYIRCEWQRHHGLYKRKIGCIKVHYLALEVEQIKSNILSTIDCTVQVMLVEIPSLHWLVAIRTEIKAFDVVEGGTAPVKKIH